MKIKYVFIIFIFGIIFIASCNKATNNQYISREGFTSESFTTVKTYFEAWNKQDYKTMYNLISDGFKQIDPTAKTYQDFESFAKKQGITSVKINSIKEVLNDGKTATVDYDVTFTFRSGEVNPFKSTFTVKYKPNDKQPGWKLIHPYGNNIDNT